VDPEFNLTSFLIHLTSMTGVSSKNHGVIRGRRALHRSRRQPSLNAWSVF